MTPTLQKALKFVFNRAFQLGAHLGMDMPVLLVRHTETEVTRSTGIWLPPRIARVISQNLEPSEYDVHAISNWDTSASDDQLTELMLIDTPDYEEALLCFGIHNSVLRKLLVASQMFARLIGRSIQQDRLTFTCRHEDLLLNKMCASGWILESDELHAFGMQAIKDRIRTSGILDLTYTKLSDGPLRWRLGQAEQGQIALDDVAACVQLLYNSDGEEYLSTPFSPVFEKTQSLTVYDKQNWPLAVYRSVSPPLADFLAENSRFIGMFPRDQSIRYPWMIYQYRQTNSTTIDIVVGRADVSAGDMVRSIGIHLPALGLSNDALIQFFDRLNFFTRHESDVSGGSPNELWIGLGSPWKKINGVFGPEFIKQELLRICPDVEWPDFEAEQSSHKLSWKSIDRGDEPSRSFDLMLASVISDFMIRAISRKNAIHLELRSRTSFNYRGQAALPWRAIRINDEEVNDFLSLTHEHGLVAFLLHTPLVGLHSGLGTSEIALTEGSDPLSPVRLMRPRGVGVEQEQLLSYLTKVHSQLPFYIAGAGPQGLELRFKHSLNPREISALAKAFSKLADISGQYFGEEGLRRQLAKKYVLLQFSGTLVHSDQVTTPPLDSTAENESDFWLQQFLDFAMNNASAMAIDQKRDALLPVLTDISPFSTRSLCQVNVATLRDFIKHRYTLLDVLLGHVYRHALGPWKLVAIDTSASAGANSPSFLPVVLVRTTNHSLIQAVNVKGKGFDLLHFSQSLEIVGKTFEGHFDLLAVGPSSVDILVHWPSDDWHQFVVDQCPNLAGLTYEQFRMRLKESGSVIHLWWD